MKIRRLTLAFAIIAGLLTFMALAGSAFAADPVTIQIKPQNNSGQSGTATLTDMGDGTTKVVVDLPGSPAGPQPIHIHMGTCANLNPQVLYPLTNMVNGKSETVVKAPLADLLAAPHSVNAHKSPQEAAVYVACGEIVSAMPTATPRTGGGGLAAGSSPLSRALLAAALMVVAGGAAYSVRRRTI